MMLALPLVLGALLGAAKWKQLHPTATPFDLQERRVLRQAKIVNVMIRGKTFSVPTAEFKAILNDFYLLDFNAIDPSVVADPIIIPFSQTKIVVRKDKSSSLPLAEIGLNSPSRYLCKREEHAGDVKYAATLHPTTERRLHELVTKYSPVN